MTGKGPSQRFHCRCNSAKKFISLTCPADDFSVWVCGDLNRAVFHCLLYRKSPPNCCCSLSSQHPKPLPGSRGWWDLTRVSEKEAGWKVSSSGIWWRHWLKDRKSLAGALCGVRKGHASLAYVARYEADPGVPKYPMARWEQALSSGESSLGLKQDFMATMNTNSSFSSLWANLLI